MKKKGLSVMLICMLVLSLFPATGESNHVYAAEETKFEERTAIGEHGKYVVPLNGSWQVNEWTDTKLNQDPYGFVTQSGYEAIMDEIKNPNYKLAQANVNIPHDLSAVSGFRYVNSVIYSTKVKLTDIMNHSFYLDFDGTNWITTVAVNGEVVGGKKSNRMPWDLDITNYIDTDTAYQLVQVIIKGPRYAIDVPGTIVRSPNQKNGQMPAGKTYKDYTKLSDYMNFDLEQSMMFLATIMPTSKGDADGSTFGLTDRLSIIATGEERGVYVSDVFVKTNVVDDQFKITGSSKYVTSEVTLVNPTNEDIKIDLVPQIKTVALKKQDGKYTKEKVYGDPEIITGLTPLQDKIIPAHTSRTLSFENVQWPDAKLWWPDCNPDTAPMYDFSVKVKHEGVISDDYNQTFGFRDIRIEGVHIRVNGVIRKFWNNLGGLRGNTPEDMINTYLSEYNRFERFGDDLGLHTALQDFYGYAPNPVEQMDWLDFMGIPVRNCSMVDGMFASYCMYFPNANERQGAGVNQEMFKNFKIQLQDMVKEQRNHPANIVWSVENELLYVNAALLYARYLDEIEDACGEYMVDPVKALDNTRPLMFDGGGAFDDNSLEMYCHHYMEEDITKDYKNSGSYVGRYSQSGWDSRYNRQRNMWKYDGKVPMAAGEIAYFSGGAIMSEYSLYIKKIYSKYRWNDAAITCPWTGGKYLASAFPAMHPLAVIRDTYDTQFNASEGATYKVKIFNDTFSTGSIEAKWSLLDADTKEVIQRGSFGNDLKIEPGLGIEKTFTINALPGLMSNRKCLLRLESSQQDSKGFRETKPFLEDTELLAFVKDEEYVVDPDVTTNNLSVGIVGSMAESYKADLKQTLAHTVDYSSFEEAYSDKSVNVLIIEANESNLAELNQYHTAAENYVKSGGWIQLVNLTSEPKALSEYNALLGTNHIVRPYREELTKRVDNWVTANLQTEDFRLWTKNVLAEWSGFYQTSRYTWSYCVDSTDDLMPFFDFESVGSGNRYTGSDGRMNWAHLQNGYFEYDHWQMIVGLWLSESQLPGNGKIVSLSNAINGTRNFFTLKNSEKLKSLSFWNADGGYTTYKSANIKVNGDMLKQVDLEKTSSEQIIDLDGTSASSMDVEFTGHNGYVSWGSGTMSAFQEMHLTRVTPDWIRSANVKSLNSVGSLVRYAREKGGFILNNVLLDDASVTDGIENSNNVNVKRKVMNQITANLLNVTEQIEIDRPDYDFGMPLTPTPAVTSTPTPTAPPTLTTSPTPTKTPNVKVTKITLNYTKKTIRAGRSFTLKVKKYTPRTGLTKAKKKVTFKSGNIKIARVGKTTGKVKAIKPGKCRITVISQNNKKVKAVCIVTVKKRR